MERDDTPLMDATGLGLLPGLAVALVLGVGVLALALLDSWWVVPAVIALVIAVTLVVVIVVLAVLDEDDQGLRRHVPGL